MSQDFASTYGLEYSVHGKFRLPQVALSLRHHCMHQVSSCHMSQPPGAYSQGDFSTTDSYRYCCSGLIQDRASPAPPILPECQGPGGPLDSLPSHNQCHPINAECPAKIHAELAGVLPGADLSHLLIVPTCQRAVMDLVKTGEEVEVEKDKLLEQVGRVPLPAMHQGVF